MSDEHPAASVVVDRSSRPADTTDTTDPATAGMAAAGTVEGENAAKAENGDATMAPAPAQGGHSPPPPPPPPHQAAPEPSTTTDSRDSNGTANVDPATAGMDASSAEAPATGARPPDETDEERAEKRRKLEGLKREARQRGNRMFGMMLGTLQRAKKEVKKVEETDAGRKRAELDAKLSEKLREERREAQEKERREKELREIKNEVHRREDDLAHAEAIYRTRHGAKLDLAGFLCTTFTPPPPPTTTDAISIPFMPRLPHAMKLTDARAVRPIYYLPYRLLPSQEDRIEDQIADAKKAIRRDREDWDEARKDKLDRLDEAKKRRAELMDEAERAQRVERQKRRREQEDRMDEDGDARGAPSKRDRGSPETSRRRRSRSRSRSAAAGGQMAVDDDGGPAAEAGAEAAAAAAAKQDDVSMAATENGGGADDEAAGAARDAKMDDELEY